MEWILSYNTEKKYTWGHFLAFSTIRIGSVRNVTHVIIIVWTLKKKNFLGESLMSVIRPVFFKPFHFGYHDESYIYTNLTNSGSRNRKLLSFVGKSPKISKFSILMLLVVFSRVEKYQFEPLLQKSCRKF